MHLEKSSQAEIKKLCMTKAPNFLLNAPLLYFVLFHLHNIMDVNLILSAC